MTKGPICGHLKPRAWWSSSKICWTYITEPRQTLSLNFRTLHKTKNNFMTMDLHPRSFPLIRLSPHFQALQIPRWNKKTYCNIPHWQGMILYYLVRLEQFLTLKKRNKFHTLSGFLFNTFLKFHNFMSTKNSLTL